MSSITTKKAIANSFKELLAKKPIEKISINDIAENCDINRQTFYYHFADITALVEWIWADKVDRVIESKEKYETWEDKFLGIFNFMLEEKIFINNIFDALSNGLLNKSLYRLVFPVIYEEISKKAKAEGLTDEEDIKFISNFYMYAFVGIVGDWVSKGMKEDPKDIVSKISNLVTGTINHACNAYKKTKK